MELVAEIASFISELCSNATNKPVTRYNTDQNCFQKDIYSDRSLDTRGVKEIGATEQSKQVTTHSYTIQPIINADGSLLSLTLIVH